MKPLYELEDFLRSVHNSSGPCGVLSELISDVTLGRIEARSQHQQRKENER